MRSVDNPVDVIRGYPHWRVQIRPTTFDRERIPSLALCWQLVNKAKLSLRGWDYPHIDYSENQENQANWVGSWANFMGHIEYWRLYQSGQFLHLFVAPEVAESSWQEKLRSRARVLIGPQRHDQVRGFLSIVNVVWRISEIFEFAARLTESQLYGDDVSIRISLLNMQGYGLSETDRTFHELYINDSEDLGREWTVSVVKLLASPAEHALVATTWLLERFSWLDPPQTTLREIQSDLIKQG